MTIKVQGPDGAVHTFPDGAKPVDIEEAMKGLYQPASGNDDLGYGQKWEREATRADVRPPADTGNLAVDTVRQFPANLTNAQNHSYAMLRSGLHDLGQGDILGGTVGTVMGGLGFVGAPVSAALAPATKPVHGMISQPLEDATGGLIPAPVTDAAVMSLIPGFGITRGPFTVPRVNPVGMTRGAGDVLLRQLSTDDTLTNTGAARIRQGGPNAMLADAGPAAANLLDTAMQRSGPGATAARQAVEQRATQANADLRGTLDRTMGAPEGVEAQQTAIRTATAPARSQAYNAAYREPIDYTTIQGRNIEQLVERVPQEAVNQANRMMRAEGQASRQIRATVHDDGTVSFEQLPDVRQLDYITRGLNEVAQGAEGQGAMRGTTAVGRIYNNLSQEIRRNLREAVPEYGHALDTAADPIQRIQATEFGATLLNPKVTRDQVAMRLQGMGAGERQATVSGLRSQIDEIASNVKEMASDPNVDARQLRETIKNISSAAAREKITAVLGPAATRQLMTQVMQSARALELRAQVATNSRTFGRTSTAAQVSAQAEPGFIGLAFEGHPMLAARKFVQGLTRMTPERRLAMEDRLYGEIADALTQNRGRAAEDFLRQLRTEVMIRAGNSARQVNRIGGTTATAPSLVRPAPAPQVPVPSMQAQPDQQDQPQAMPPPAAPNQTAWTGKGGPLLDAKGQAVNPGTKETFKPSTNRSPVIAAAKARSLGYPEWAIADQGFLFALDKGGKAQADKWLLQSAKPDAAPPAKPTPIKSSRDIALDAKLAMTPGRGPTVDYSKYGGPNKPLSDMTPDEIRAAARNIHLNPDTMDPEMASIENSRRYIQEQQALAASGQGFTNNATDVYRQSQAPDALIAQRRALHILADRLGRAKSNAERVELLKQIVANQLVDGATEPKPEQYRVAR